MTHAEDQPSPPRRASRLQTPLVSALLALLLLGDVLTLPHETTVGALVHERLHPDEIHCDEHPPLAYLVREDGELRLAAFDDPAAVAFRAGQDDPEIHRAILTCEPEVTSTGFWGVTRSSFDHTMTIRRRTDEPLPPHEAERARALFVPFALERGLPPVIATHMARGDGARTLIRWEGYLRNAGSLLVALALPFSLRWVVP